MSDKAKIIDGNVLAAKVREELVTKIANCSKAPVLAVVQIGNNDASRIYVRNKQKEAQEVGIKCEIHELSADVTQGQLQQFIETLNHNPEVNGIIIQQPLPKHLEVLPVLQLIDPKKDVDGFGPINLGLLVLHSSQALIAATPKGILKMLKSTEVNLQGKHAVIIGRSNIVGKPLAQLLLNQDCTVTIAHSKTQNLSQITSSADIVIAACGCPKMVEASWLKTGAIVIDVGINREQDGKLCGDVNFDDVFDKVSFISPVPGGVGPMTVAMLLENTYEAYLRQQAE